MLFMHNQAHTSLLFTGAFVCILILVYMGLRFLRGKVSTFDNDPGVYLVIIDSPRPSLVSFSVHKTGYGFLLGSTSRKRCH